MAKGKFFAKPVVAPAAATPAAATPAADTPVDATKGAPSSEDAAGEPGYEARVLVDSIYGKANDLVVLVKSDIDAGTKAGELDVSDAAVDYVRELPQNVKRA